MASKLVRSKTNSSSIYIFEFYYYDVDNLFFFLGEERESKKALLGKVAIRTPYWTDIYDINRMSKGITREVTPDNPYGKKKKTILPDKYKSNKIKVLLEYIEDSQGNRHHVTNELVECMDVDLSRFILQKIDEVIDENPIISLEKDEADKLSLDCYNYFAAEKKKKRDPKVEIPEPPSIVILVRLSQLLKRSIEEVKKMDKRDIDSVMIMNQQENITRNPAMIGGGGGGPGHKALMKGGKFDMVFTGHNVIKNKDIVPRSISKEDLLRTAAERQEQLIQLAKEKGLTIPEKRVDKPSGK